MRSIRALFVVALIFLACEDSLQAKPAISPRGEQLVKNEGDSLEIVCRGLSTIYFSYPVNESIDGEVKITSEPEIAESKSDGIFKYEFRRRNTLPEDTGWYGCAYHPINSTEEFYFNPNVAWIYVYVQSKRSFFAEPDFLPTTWAFTGEDTTIPCRPTSPDYEVHVTSNDKPVVLGDKVSYDPRFGLKIKNVTVHDHGWYICSITKDSIEQRATYYLHVNIQRPLPQPKIVDDTLRYVTLGQTLHVNCTVDVSGSMLYVLNWTTPQESDRITVKHYCTDVDFEIKRVTSMLTITNVTYNDEGEYECSIKSYRESTKSTKRYISVHDPHFTYINLTSQDSNRYYQSKENDWVQWVVYVDAYPELEHLYWLNAEGQKIDATWKEPERAKYAISRSPSSTVLRINHLKISDMGVYSLEGSIKDKTDMLNFTLDVMAKPTIILQALSTYYAPNQSVDLQCDVIAYPKPNITFTYLKCPYYPSRQNCTAINLQPFKENENYRIPETGVTISFSSFARMTVEYTGTVTCSSCNTMGCNSVTEIIFVSDGNEGFGIIEPRIPIIEGDDLDLVCAASIYNFSRIMEWSYENNKPIVESDRINILQNKTDFTYRSILRIKDIQKEDGKRYVCTGRTSNGATEQMDYTVRVEEATAPYFISTNMNKTAKVVDPNNENVKTDVILECFAGGLPKPNITWYKDGTMLNASKKYSMHKDNQILYITYPRERDTGKYSCKVANRIGKLEASQQITVKGTVLPTEYVALIVVLVIAVLFLVVYFMWKVRRERIMRKELMAAGLMHFEEGALECLNPDLTVDDQAELLPYDKRWEFPRERLRLGKKLGSGAFGVVMKAEAQGISEDEDVTTVAVKMVRRTTDPTYVRALASELKIMVHLGKHLNVVNLLGACTKNISKRELLVIVEYCRFGNLHNYLLRHRADFINQIDPATGKFDPSIGLEILNRTLSVSSNNRIKYAALSFSRSLSANSGTESVHYCQGTGTDSQGVSMSPDGCVMSNNSSQPGWRSNYRGDYKDHNLKPICTQDLLSWAFQVARGMEYLSHRRVLHGDLAARNILLAENNVVKICDFGLAKTMYKDDNYKKKGDGPLPIKWMAIESIRDRIFSTQSDIWSFGIVLWEFFTLAETPYPGMEAEKQYQKLIEGYRMEQPEYAMSSIYDIMLQCWKAKPTLRPSFTELVESIGDLLEESVRAHYISLNAPYMDMNTMFQETGRRDYLTMMSAPDHVALSSPTHEYVNSPIPENQPDSAYLCMSPASARDESGIFSPRPLQEETHFDFPSPTSDGEDAVELSPMLKTTEDDDPYLKPINVHERRAEFARQRQAMKNQAVEQLNDRDSGYCNAPRNLHLIDLNEKNNLDSDEQEKSEVDSNIKKKDLGSSIIRTQDNYVNMPKQKSDLRRDMPDGFSNPSYVMMGHREAEQGKV